MSVNIVSVVCPGPTVKESGAAHAPGMVIAVNDGYKYCNPRIVLSMDGRWARYRQSEMYAHPAELWLRRSAYNKLEDVSRRVNVFDCDVNARGFDGDTGPCRLDGDNSGYLALQLAWFFCPSSVFVYGMDMTLRHGSHEFGEYEWRRRGEGCSLSGSRFSKWRADIKDYALRKFMERGTKVYKMSARSENGLPLAPAGYLHKG